MSYRIEFTRGASKAFLTLPKRDRATIEKKIDALAHNPRPNGVEKLSGEENLYRLRSGDYRVIYQILDKVLRIIVVKIGHRREVYR